MGAVGEFAGRVRGYFASAGRGLSGVLRRGARDLTVTVEERPDVGPLEVELPYPLPTRDQPLAYILFYVSFAVVVVTVTLTVGTLVALGEVPAPLALTMAATATALGVVANLGVVVNYLEERSSTLLRPLVGAGVPLLNALHYWFNPAGAVLALLFVLTYRWNNLLLPAAALVLVVWTVTGLLLKLPRDSPWNGPMLVRWAGILHRRPFIYVVVIALAFVGALAETVH